MCPAYVAELIGPGDRKSIQPRAARDGGVCYDQLHHFVASGVWDATPLQAAPLAAADRQVGGDDAWLIVDGTASAEEGESLGRGRAAIRFDAGQERQLSDPSVADAGVARGAGDGRFAAVPARALDERSGPARSHRCARRSAVYRTKPEIALAEFDRVRAAGARFGCVLADRVIANHRRWRPATPTRTDNANAIDSQQ
jgi:SRSO17 transposase